jgi:hypothetical protein
MFSVLDIFIREFLRRGLVTACESRDPYDARRGAQELWHVVELNCQRTIALDVQTLCQGVLRLTLPSAPSRMFEARRVAIRWFPAWGKTLIY